jgi:hypothetical protein
MVNWFLALMVHQKQLTLEEAEHLAKELPLKLYTQNFAEAHKVIEQLLKEVERKK